MINWIKIYPKNTVGFWKKLLRPSHQKIKSYSLKLEKCHVLMDISWCRRSLVQSSLQQANLEYHQNATAYFSGPWKRYFSVWQVLFGCMSEDISKICITRWYWINAINLYSMGEFLWKECATAEFLPKPYLRLTKTDTFIWFSHTHNNWMNPNLDEVKFF